VEGGGLVPRRLREVQARHLGERRRRPLRRSGHGRRRAGGAHRRLVPLRGGRGRRGLGRVRVSVGGGGARLGRRVEALAYGGELGVDGGVERAGEVRAAAAEGGEVEARRVAAEAEGRLVVGERGFLGGVECPQPQPRPVPRQADLRHPLAPVPLAHAAVQLPRGRRRHPGMLHQLRPRGEERRRKALLLLLLLRQELHLDLLDLRLAQVGQPRRGGVRRGGRQRRELREGGGRGRWRERGVRG
jgi:hypothetical protein